MIDRSKSASRYAIVDLIEQQHLQQKDIPEAIEVANLYPSGLQWQRFLRDLLFWSGAIGMAFGVIFFVAANWQYIGRITKFVLLEVIIMAAIIACWKFHHHERLRQASLLLAMLTVGGLMSLFGQTYQTGADPWQLFFNWALLTLPWVVVSRFSALWLIWLGLINLALGLYLSVFGQLSHTLIPMFLLNSFALCAWQIGSRRFNWLNTSWAINIIAVVSVYYACALLIEGLFEDNYLGIICWFAWLGIVFYLFRRVNLNVFVLSGWCLSLIVGANSLIFWVGEHYDHTIVFLLLTAVTIGGGGYATLWLKGLIDETNA